MKDINTIKEDSFWMRNRLLELGLKAGANGSHLGGALSLVEILAALYSRINLEIKDDLRDRVILSKGHGAMALYCILERYGILSPEEVDTFETNSTKYFSHVSRDTNKLIEFSGGSLGLGVSYGVGVALADKIKGLNNRIYIIMGDGECNEGIVWEALMTAKNQKLNNITFIVDCNGLQADGPTSEVMDMISLSDKFAAFGMEVTCIDGHSPEEIMDALGDTANDKCNVIIANTVKGKGISFMENVASWHHGVLNQKKYESAKEELNSI